jgi:hypothetical protein
VTLVESHLGWSGKLLLSSDNALPPGKIRVGVEIEPYDFTQSPGHLEVLQPKSGKILIRKELPPTFIGGIFSVELYIDRTIFGGQFNLVMNGCGNITANMAFCIEIEGLNKDPLDLSENYRNRYI